MKNTSQLSGLPHETQIECQNLALSLKGRTSSFQPGVTLLPQGGPEKGILLLTAKSVESVDFFKKII